MYQFSFQIEARTERWKNHKENRIFVKLESKEELKHERKGDVETDLVLSKT